jgi:hypothetical protein
MVPDFAGSKKGPANKRFTSSLLQNRPPKIAVIMVSALKYHRAKSENLSQKKTLLKKQGSAGLQSRDPQRGAAAVAGLGVDQHRCHTAKPLEALGLVMNFIHS